MSWSSCSSKTSFWNWDLFLLKKVLFSDHLRPSICHWLCFKKLWVLKICQRRRLSNWSFSSSWMSPPLRWRDGKLAALANIGLHTACIGSRHSQSSSANMGLAFSYHHCRQRRPHVQRICRTHFTDGSKIITLHELVIAGSSYMPRQTFVGAHHISWSRVTGYLFICCCK